VQTSILTQAEKAINAEEWKKAKALIASELKKDPKNFCFLSNLSVAYYDKEKYEEALKFAEKAYEIASNDPLIIFNYAKALYMMGREGDARILFKKILRKTVKTVSKYGQGVHWAQSLINDCRYLLGLCYKDMGNSRLAIKWLKEHFKHLGGNVQSNYNIKHTRKVLQTLENIKLIEKAMNDTEDYKKARLLIQKELKKEPDDAWLLDCLATTYYEQHDYKKALELSKKAYNLSPNDPLFIWGYAGVSDMTGHKQKAIQLYEIILQKGLKTVAFGEGGEGLQWAKRLINDSMYRIGMCYMDIKNYTLAIKWLKKHLKNRRLGTPSLYNANKVKKFLKFAENKGGGIKGGIKGGRYEWHEDKP
jgi:tetratricopeptide (TPR) repeat protein